MRSQTYVVMQFLYVLFLRKFAAWICSVLRLLLYAKTYDSNTVKPDFSEALTVHPTVEVPGTMNVIKQLLLSM